MINKQICLFGASGHGKVVKDVALNNNIEVVVFVDDNPKDNKLHNISVLKTNEKRIEKFKKYKFVISIGSNIIRKKVSERFNVNYTTLIDKSVVKSKYSTIGLGTVVMPSAVINADTKIGEHVIINTGSVIEHDCLISDFVHISPNATIAGGVTIGQGTHIGAGVVIIPNIKVGRWVTIGAGAVVINNIPDYSTVVGVPARVIKIRKHEQE